MTCKLVYVGQKVLDISYLPVSIAYSLPATWPEKRSLARFHLFTLVFSNLEYL